jgi:calcyclin binding protein
MVSVFLAKSAPGVKWSDLRPSEPSKLDAAPAPKAEPDADPSDPSAGLMTMMKKMYEEGDDEMKRTIAKAWTESKDNKSNPMDNIGMP